MPEGQYRQFAGFHCADSEGCKYAKPGFPVITLIRLSSISMAFAVLLRYQVRGFHENSPRPCTGTLRNHNMCRALVLATARALSAKVEAGSVV